MAESEYFWPFRSADTENVSCPEIVLEKVVVLVPES